MSTPKFYHYLDKEYELIRKKHTRLLQTGGELTVRSQKTTEKKLKYLRKLSQWHTCMDSKWHSRFNQICILFGIAPKDMDYILSKIDGYVSGSSAMWSLNPWCTADEFDGDIDIYVSYDLRQCRKTETLLDLALGRYNFYCSDTLQELQVCPECNDTTSHLKIINPCGHKICKECITTLEDKSRSGCIKCPMCNTPGLNFKINRAYSHVTNRNELPAPDDSGSGQFVYTAYGKFIKIDYFKEYIHKSGRKIQVIWVRDPEDCISRFDLTCCSVYIRNEELKYMYHNIAILPKTVVFTFLGNIHEKNQARIQKYKQRGYSVQYIEQEKTIDHLIHHTNFMTFTGFPTDLVKFVLKDYVYTYGQELIDSCAK
jgi:hypothetical protein